MKSLNPNIDRFYKKFRKKLPPAKVFLEEIRKGNREYLGRAITLIESEHPGHRALGEEIVNLALPFSGHAFRIGITGVPGAGKSTFIDRLGSHYAGKNHRVAVLAIDPSSALNKGSILGDKTRMENLMRYPDVFIRPSPSGDHSGGVGRKTRESIILCEAAGYDRILVETVGVGQSEVYVHSMTDFFLLLKIPNAGDELQGIKRGIMEMADAIIINKADGPLEREAGRAEKIFKTALHYFTFRDTSAIPVMRVSSLEDKGIDKVMEMLEEKYGFMKVSGKLEEKRRMQRKFWMEENLNDMFRMQFLHDPELARTRTELEKLVIRKEITPYMAAQQLWEHFMRRQS